MIVDDDIKKTLKTIETLVCTVREFIELAESDPRGDSGLLVSIPPLLEGIKQEAKTLEFKIIYP